MGLGVRASVPKELQDDHWSCPSQGVFAQILHRNLQVTFSQVMWGWTSQCPWCSSHSTVVLEQGAYSSASPCAVLCSESKRPMELRLEPEPEVGAPPPLPPGTHPASLLPTSLYLCPYPRSSVAKVSILYQELKYHIEDEATVYSEWLERHRTRAA